MSALKLGRLPDRKPVKIGLMIAPDLHARLIRYAAAYAEAYGVEETIEALIPAMLDAFLESDRNFARRA